MINRSPRGPVLGSKPLTIASQLPVSHQNQF
jgi:hypothetical protein